MAMIKRLSVWMSVVACLAAVTGARAAQPSYVWWEGEATTETNFSQQSGFSADTFASIRNEVLSAGDWLTNGENRAPGEAEPFATYRVHVPADGVYQLYTRKFWKHGPFRWRFGEGEWQTCGGDVALLDSTPIRQFLEANWVRLGEVKLKAGDQTFELRLLASVGQSKVAAFDAFVLMQSPFVPRGKLKPDGKSGRAADGFWAFEPDADTFEHKDLDLRSLNESQAGVSGHVRREGGRFVLGDGRPARFWAVQADTRESDNASVDFLARRLAKAGVNLVRMEANVRDGSSADPTAVSREKLDRLHYVIAALKREGIYTYLGHNFWGTSFTAKDSYGIPGFHDGDKGAALLIFSPRMQEIYKAWAKVQLTTVNPYTGVSLAKEPALAVYEVQNEDSYFWWSFDWNLKDPEKLASLEVAYGKWLAKRYGTLDKALAAWGQRDNRDRPQEGRAAFLNTYQLTEGGIAQAPATRKRASDQLRFLVEHQRAFYAGMAQYLHEDLGLQSLVSASNWKTADARVLDSLERYTYMATDVLCDNNYFVPPYQSKRQHFYAVDAGEVYADRPGLLEPQNLPIQLFAMADRPHMVTEMMWERPNRYRAEFPFLAATYGALQGMDGWVFFAVGGPEWESSPKVWSVMSPAMFGQFPALALMYRRGDVREADRVVFDVLDMDEQCNFQGSAALQVQALDEFRKKEVPAGGVLTGQSVPAIDPLAFYVGRVERSFAAQPDEAMARELSPFINRQAKTIRSVTDELYWDYGQGFITLKTPRSQGVAGFVAKAGRVDLGDVMIESGNDYAVIVVVALDDQPLASSRRILIQAMTDDQFYGWKTEPQAKGQKIVSLGGYPVNVRKIDAKVTFKNNARARRALVLDGNANPTEQTAALKRSGSSVTLSLPADAMYTIME